MESDLANPAADAFYFTVEDLALETSIRPVAIFADMNIVGRITAGGDGDAAADDASTATVTASASGWDPRLIAVLAIAVLVIGVVALTNRKG